MTKTDTPAPSLANVAPLPPVYFDPATGRYYVRNKHAEWMGVNPATVESYLVFLGYNPGKGKDEDQSEVARTILRIQLEKSIHYAGPLAGYKPGPKLIGTTRVLVTKAVLPVAPGPGDWPALRLLLTNMLGAVQLDHAFGWIKQTLAMLRSGKQRPGQALVICGPPGAGKSLFGEVLTALFGGEPGHPWKFLTDKTQFNSDLFASVLLVIDDAAESTELRVRRTFGANIKQVVAVRSQACHKKHCEQLSLRPLWRLLILLNDDPERLMVLPPLDTDIQDKLMLLKAEAHKMPMPTDTPEEAEIFFNTLVSELPAFVSFIDGWTVPPDLASSRYGIKRYHHPDIARDIEATSPQEQLREVLDEVIFGSLKALVSHTPWEGKASDLLALLTAKDSDRAKDAERLLAGGSAVCGKYLARLEKQDPQRFSHILVEKTCRWTIQPPSRVPSATGPRSLAELEARIRARAEPNGEHGNASVPLQAQPLSP